MAAIFHERITRAKIPGLLAGAPKQAALLLRLYREADPDTGERTITYKHGKGRSSGRLYAEGGGLQGLERGLRNTLADGRYYDIDLANSTPCAFRNLCREANIPCPRTEFYVDNRTEWLQSLVQAGHGVADWFQAKMAVIKVFHGGETPADMLYGPLVQLRAEVKANARRLALAFPETFQRVVSKLHGATEGKALGSFVFEITTQREAEWLDTARLWMEQAGWQVATPIFDGCLVYRREGIDFPLAALNTRFAAERVVWKIKQMPIPPAADSLRRPDGSVELREPTCLSMFDNVQVYRTPEQYKPYTKPDGSNGFGLWPVDFSDHKIQVIAASCGLGKSHVMMDAIVELGPDASILIITPRQQFAVTMAARLAADPRISGFSCYLDTGGILPCPGFNLRGEKRFICQVESLYKLMGDIDRKFDPVTQTFKMVESPPFPYDLLLIDEGHSATDQWICEDTQKRTHSNNNYVFQRVLYDAARTLILGADVLDDHLMANFLTSSFPPASLEVHAYCWLPADLRRSVQLVESEEEWRERIRRDLKQKKQLLVCFRSRKTANELFAELSHELPDAKLELLDGSTRKKRMQTVLQDVDGWFDGEDGQALIITPKVTVGVNCMKRINAIYGHAECFESCPPRIFWQMLHRVRRPLDSVIYLWLGPGGLYATKEQQVRRDVERLLAQRTTVVTEIAERENKVLRPTPEKMHAALVEHCIERNMSTQFRFAYTFLDLTLRKGMGIECDPLPPLLAADEDDNDDEPQQEEEILPSPEKKVCRREPVISWDSKLRSALAELINDQPDEPLNRQLLAVEYSRLRQTSEELNEHDEALVMVGRELLEHYKLCPHYPRSVEEFETMRDYYIKMRRFEHVFREGPKALVGSRDTLVLEGALVKEGPELFSITTKAFTNLAAVLESQDEDTLMGCVFSKDYLDSKKIEMRAILKTLVKAAPLRLVVGRRLRTDAKLGSKILSKILDFVACKTEYSRRRAGRSGMKVFYTIVPQPAHTTLDAWKQEYDAP